jgi:hypothetical protein
MIGALALIILFLIMGARYQSRSFVVQCRWRIFGTAVLVIATTLSIVSAFHYQTWAGHPLTKLLLPPYTAHWYVLQYIGFRIWAPYIFSLLLGAMLGYAAHWYNRRHGNDLLYEEEPYMIALSIFLVGQPGWIFYFILILLVALCALLLRAAFGVFDKFSLYDLWFPLAAFVILIMQWLAALPWFALLKP